jgi:hypothetical protein
MKCSTSWRWIWEDDTRADGVLVDGVASPVLQSGGMRSSLLLN